VSRATAIEPPPGIELLPDYDGGWVLSTQAHAPYLSYVDVDTSVNWSEDLELLHEEDSRSHFIDQWTRSAIVDRVGELPSEATIVDVGASTGYLLEDLATAFPEALLIGVDLVSSGLRKAHAALPRARLLHADACALPLAPASVDCVVSANLLEHVPDDRRALAEMARVLKPGARAVIVVPYGPSTYDYYDRFLGHERRYARSELADKAATAGLEVIENDYIAALLYPAFWSVKHYNKVRYGALEGSELERRVAGDIARTRDSTVGRGLWAVERRLRSVGIRPPFGIRCVVVLRARVGG
jgi:SAM-dependent methyltransferase